MKVLFATLGLLLSGYSALAAELHVGAEQQYTSLAAGVSAALAGDTIYVHAGEYNEAVRIRIPLTIKAVGIAYVHATGINLSGDATTPRAILELYEGATGTLIEGLSLAHAANGSTNSAGIRLIGTRSVTIRNCNISDCDNGLFTSQASCTDLLLEDSRFEMNGRSATSHNVYLSEGQRATIRNCVFDGTIGGQNVKSRIRYLLISGCTLRDSKNREFDGVESDSTTEPGGYVIVEGCRIIKRWCVEQPDGTYSYFADPAKRPANNHVIQWGDDRSFSSINTGTLYLLNNVIVTPFPQPVVSLTSLTKVVAEGNTILRPQNTTGQGNTQRFIRLGDEQKARGSLNRLSPTFVDWAEYGTQLSP